MRCPKNRSINYAEWGRSTTKRQHQQQQRTDERGLERRRREKNKSYRNIYIKLNCTMKEYLYNAWRGTRLCVKRASFLWRHRLNGKHSIRSITMEIMDKTHTHTQIFFRTIFYKQSDNRFLMASLRFFFSFSFLFVLFFSPVLFSLSLSSQHFDSKKYILHPQQRDISTILVFIAIWECVCGRMCVCLFVSFFPHSCQKNLIRAIPNEWLKSQ